MFIILLSVLMSWSSIILASPAEEPEDHTIPILESTQELFGLNINRVANRIDMFFADQRADDELARSLIRLRRSYEIREDHKMVDNTQFRFNIRLPSLQEKFRFQFQNRNKDDKSNVKVAKKGDTIIVPPDPNKLNTDWQFRSDIGVNASIPPQIFSHGRLRKNWQTWQVIHRMANELAWYSDRNWEELSTLDSDLPLAENLLFRFRSLIDWKISKETFQTSHGPSLLQRLSDNDAISYGTGLSTTIVNNAWFLSNYRISTTYRRNLYKQWLFADLTPGLDFPKLYGFRRSPFVFFQLEALFGAI